MSASTTAKKFVPNTQGWYITGGIVVSVMLANVPVVGPLALGVLSLALLYQFSLLLQHK